MNKIPLIIITLLTLLASPLPIKAQEQQEPSTANAIVAGELVIEPPTLICLGFQWQCTGDANANATVELEFRRTGAEEWKPAQPLLRIPNDPAEDPTVPEFAGSIFDLDPGTAYECRLTMKDADGVEGEAVRTVTVRTRAEAREWAEGPVRHVYPFNHEGEIPEGAYYGLMAAFRDRPNHKGGQFGTGQGPAVGVEPGMRFLLHAGTYKADRYQYRDPYFLIGWGTYHIAGLEGTAENPIVIRPAGDGEVIFDGDGAFRLFDLRTARHLVLEGVTIENTEVGVWLGDFGESLWAEDVTIRHCTFREVTHGVIGRHPNSLNYTVTDNWFYGRGPQGQNVEANIAVLLAGKGHVMAYNYCDTFFDFTNGGRNGEVTYSYMYEPGQDSAIDCYNNDLRFIKDNALCTGGRTHNIRFFRNRILNQGGATLAPYGTSDSGPIYWIRNVTHGHEGFKFLRSGNLAWHNTCQSGLMGRIESNSETFNNLWLASQAREDRQPLVLFYPPIWKDNVEIDYNAWHLPSDDPAQAVFAQISEETFPTLDAYQQAHERFSRHAVMVSLNDFQQVPADWNEYGSAITDYDALDLRPKPGTPAHDAAKLLPNINDDFTGAAPDIGALEAGKPLPHYGPRER